VAGDEAFDTSEGIGVGFARAQVFSLKADSYRMKEGLRIGTDGFN
jgi:hypothetical protein